MSIKSGVITGVEFVVADHRVKAAIRNALDCVPTRGSTTALQELRWMYDRRDLPEARVDLCDDPFVRAEPHYLDN